MNDVSIFIYENKNSQRIIKSIPLDSFTAGFQKKYNNGEIQVCYYNRNGALVARDIWDRIYYKILHNKKISHVQKEN